ncbi:DMT family transporter [Moritella sp. F3]|uniref:DMT family transporter n=1 Tax=Moritella sp. F3 TaxID=2718882 RepID=UPI0018E18282|nr:DMT family transporter [Moritella sp. F3]GIC78366.1 multidrug DMT transporter permease [Moritella sp. F1]GIC83701.1 multidrug DMT transporter permease [Moritella sp. F3]
MNTKLVATLLFASVCLIWGTTWMAMEIAVHSIPPITATGLRFALAAPLLILAARWLKIPLMFPKGKKLEFALISVFYFAAPFTLMIFGEQYISSGLASIIFATMPVVVLGFAILVHRQKVHLHQIAGLAIALFSLITIISNEMGVSANGSLIGVGALVLAVFMHATIYTSVQTRCQGIHVLTYNALPCLVASVLLLVVGAFVEQPDFATFTLTSWLSVIYLGAIAGIGGIMAYFQLNKVASPFQASICFLVFPVIALGLDSVVNGRTISHESLFMMVLLTAGVLLCKLPLELISKRLTKTTVKVEKSS